MRKRNFKNYLVIVGFGVLLCFFMQRDKQTPLDYCLYTTEGLELNFDQPQSENKTQDAFAYYVPYPIVGNDFLGFKEALAFKESQGDYFAVNTYGYLGKYQFGKNTLSLLGINSPKKFLKDPILQEKAFIANTERNKWILRRDIKRFAGRSINGLKITESGILAAAHLVGAGSVKKYLRSNGAQTFVDGYGTTIESYLKKFSNYEVSELNAIRLPAIVD